MKKPKVKKKIKLSKRYANLHEHFLKAHGLVVSPLACPICEQTEQKQKVN